MMVCLKYSNLLALKDYFILRVLLQRITNQKCRLKSTILKVSLNLPWFLSTQFWNEIQLLIAFLNFAQSKQIVFGFDSCFLSWSQRGLILKSMKIQKKVTYSSLSLPPLIRFCSTVDLETISLEFFDSSQVRV